MLPNPRKTTSIRPLGHVDISGLRKAVLAIPDSVWNAENEEKPNHRYKAFNDTATSFYGSSPITRTGGIPRAGRYGLLGEMCSCR